jgi:hypothetical protein
MSLAHAWNRFWFAPQATSSLALLRIAFGSLTVMWAMNLAPDVDTFLAPNGLVDGHGAAPLVLAGLVLAATGVAVGFYTRLSCATVLLCLLWIDRINPLIWNSGDVLLRHVALFLTLAPAGDALSVDRWRRDRDRFWDFPSRAPWALRLVQIQLVLMYIVTVVAKLQGASWRSGEAVSYILRVPEDARFALPTAITAAPLGAGVLTYGTLAVEAAIPLLIWNRRLRPFVLGVGAFFHLAIAVTLRVGLFSWIVLVTYLAFVPPESASRFLCDFRRRIRHL